MEKLAISVRRAARSRGNTLLADVAQEPGVKLTAPIVGDNPIISVEATDEAARRLRANYGDLLVIEPIMKFTVR